MGRDAISGGGSYEISHHLVGPLVLLARHLGETVDAPFHVGPVLPVELHLLEHHLLRGQAARRVIEIDNAFIENGKIAPNPFDIQHRVPLN